MTQSSKFHFKQFSVQQDKCAMKIGTDGVLLAAWSSLKHNPSSILDIGAGTGVLSLILAQRSNAELIDALEIDEHAHEQCVENFEQSPWGDRLFCYHASLKEFMDEIDEKYELIVCNPPFYSEQFKTNDIQRNQARFQDAMPFHHLIEGVSKLLSQNGTFNVVIPFKEEQTFVHLASEFNLFPKHTLRVKGNPKAEIKRSFIEFSFQKFSTKAEQLIIETKRHHYTDAYVKLTKDFYLKM